MERTFQVATFLKHLVQTNILSCDQLESVCHCGQHIFEICGDRPSFVSLKILTMGTRKALLSCYLNRSIADIDFPWDAVRVRSHSFRSLAEYTKKPYALQELHNIGEVMRVAITHGVPTQIKNVMADCVIQAQEIRFLYCHFH